MDDVMIWAALLGAWLLVAGALYQAVLQLREEAIESERIDQVRGSMKPVVVSKWWWVVPPLHFLINRHRTEKMRDEVLAELPDDVVEALAQFMDKAFGWMLVAGGSLFLALAETYNLTDKLGWSIAWFIVLALAMGALAVSNSVYRVKRGANARSKRAAAPQSR